MGDKNFKRKSKIFQKVIDKLKLIYYNYTCKGE